MFLRGECWYLLQVENGRRPLPYNRDDAASVLDHAQKINNQATNKVDLDKVHSASASYLYVVCFKLLRLRLQLHIMSRQTHNTGTLLQMVKLCLWAAADII